MTPRCAGTVLHIDRPELAAGPGTIWGPRGPLRIEQTTRQQPSCPHVKHALSCDNSRPAVLGVKGARFDLGVLTGPAYRPSHQPRSARQPPSSHASSPIRHVYACPRGPSVALTISGAPQWRSAQPRCCPSMKSWPDQRIGSLPSKESNQRLSL